MLITNSWWVDLGLLIAPLLILLYKYLTRNRHYWKERGIAYSEPVFLFGNIFDVLLLRKTFMEWIREQYNATDGPLYGVFLFDQPGLIVRSAKIIKDILIKDFNWFGDRHIACPQHNEVTRNMMFFQRGEDWKVQRSKLTPVFTSGKLRGMLPILNEYAKTLVQRLQRHSNDVDVKVIASDYVTDGVTKCFFGIECYSQEDRASEFKTMLRKTVQVPMKIVISRICYFFYPKLVNPLRLEFGVQHQVDYFCDAFADAIKLREKSKIRLNDFIDIINDMRHDEESTKGYSFTSRGFLGQPFMFFIAAQSTTAAVLTFTLYELARNPKIQEKAREDVLKALKQREGMTYEALMDMKYLDMCMQESLRKYPAVAFLDRRCNDEYVIEEANLKISEGQQIYIPVYGLHHDPQFFPEPEKFLPERFMDKDNINSSGLYYLPFGDGPRGCIGERFGRLNAKLALAHVLANFELELPVGHPDDIKFDIKSFTIEAAPGSVKLNFKQLRT